MTPQNVRFFDRRKFIWDGEAYDSPAAAEAKKSEYEGQGFETQLVEEEGEAPPVYAESGERGRGRRRAPAGCEAPGRSRYRKEDMNMAAKVAEEWLNICGGCEVSILDIGEPAPGLAAPAPVRPHARADGPQVLRRRPARARRWRSRRRTSGSSAAGSATRRRSTWPRPCARVLQDPHRPRLVRLLRRHPRPGEHVEAGRALRQGLPRLQDDRVRADTRARTCRRCSIR